MAGGRGCVRVNITDDEVVEPDESFEVVFTEMDQEMAPECAMDDGGGGSGGSGEMPDKTNGMLLPMVSSETVLITITDNDAPVGGSEGV